MTGSGCVVEGCQGADTGEGGTASKLTIVALAAVDVSLKIVWPPYRHVTPGAPSLRDGRMVGSRCAVEDCFTAGAISINCAAVADRSAGRTRRIVEDCMAGDWLILAPTLTMDI